MIEKWRAAITKGTDGSKAVSDTRILEEFIAKSDFTFLVSFPRTGSHWLRMVMELYFERPSLVRTFFYHDRQDFLTFHTHDMGLDLLRKNVIYLYREPVATIYSQMIYEKEDIQNADRVNYWASYYARHLKKWLLEEKVSEKKTLINYDLLLDDPCGEFSKMVGHFGWDFDRARCEMAVQRVSKEDVKRKTSHDRRVINLDKYYIEQRVLFHRRFGVRIHDSILQESEALMKCFQKRQWQDEI